MESFKLFLILIFFNFGCLEFTDIDYYQPTFEAVNKAKQIMKKYESFKGKIETNLEYDKCIEQIKEKKCNNLDQWQSQIEELKLQISNSKQIETPFLEQRRDEKVKRLEQLLALGEQQKRDFGDMTKQLRDYQSFLKQNTELPEQQDDEEALSLIQEIDISEELNSNIPDIANQKLEEAKQQYEIGDISIQAQIATNVMLSAQHQVKQILQTTKESQFLENKDQLKEKEELKESIEQLKALLANEQWVQQASQAKIDELEGKIAACAGMPTNLQKDCEFLKLKQKKKNVEIAVVQARTMLLFEQLKQLMEENKPKEDTTKIEEDINLKAIVEEETFKEKQ